MRARWVVGGAAAAAALSRVPGAWWPLRPDEAGYTLVAAAWDPLTDERLYGTYWVDRAPTLVAAFRLAVELGAPELMRLAAALGCAVTVVLAAVAGRSLARLGGAPSPGAVTRTGAWTAVATAALVSNAMIDPVSAKGELLGLPWMLGSACCALLGLERRSAPLAAAAGLTAVVGVGMKQSLVGGLVLGGLLLAGALLRGRLPLPTAARLAAAAVVGALLPVAAVVGWALASGIELDSLTRTVVGFRGEALEVIVTGSLAAPLHRAQVLVVVLVASGMLAVLALFVRGLPLLWARCPVPTLAVLGMLTVEIVMLALSGSYWTPYLFGLVPGLALSTALLVLRHELLQAGAAAPPMTSGTPSWRPVRPRLAGVHRVVGFATVSTLASLVVFTAWVLPTFVHTEARLGQALARSAEQGDTLVVYGGRPDVVYASGMSSPYRHLWNLPMRTLDPRLRTLRRVLADDDRRPTWLVVGVPLWAWEGFGEPLRPLLERYYELHGRTCKGRPVLLRDDVSRPRVVPDCD